MFNGVSYLDSATCFTGTISDVICCVIIYQKSNRLMKLGATVTGRPGSLLGIVEHIKKSSLARVVIMSAVKIVNGAFLVTHPCEMNTEVCQYGFLRGVITTLDYQLYYMDYLLVEFQKGRTIMAQDTTSAFGSKLSPTGDTCIKQDTVTE